MKHIETKDKGDNGVIKIISYLAEHNIKVALPMSEHLPFDIIAINQDCKLSRISIKYRKIHAKGHIEVPLRTISSNSKGYKIKHTCLDEIDAFAIYCPDNDECYFIRSEILRGMTSGLSLRISPDVKRKGNKTIRWAKDYQNEQVIFQ
jgi:hypothetical protein